MQREDRDRATIPQPPTHFKPVEAREHEIQHNEIGLVPLADTETVKTVKTVKTVIRDGDVEAFVTKPIGNGPSESECRSPARSVEILCRSEVIGAPWKVVGCKQPIRPCQYSVVGPYGPAGS